MRRRRAETRDGAQERGYRGLASPLCRCSPPFDDIGAAPQSPTRRCAAANPLARPSILRHNIPMPSPSYTQDLLEKIRALPEDKIAEVADFVEFLRLRTEEQQASTSVTKLSESAFQKVWNNPDDAEYDPSPTLSSLQ